MRKHKNTKTKTTKIKYIKTKQTKIKNKIKMNKMNPTLNQKRTINDIDNIKQNEQHLNPSTNA